MYKTEEKRVFDLEVLKVGTIVKVTKPNESNNGYDDVYNGIIIKSSKDNLDILTIKKFEANISELNKLFMTCLKISVDEFEEKTSNKYIPEKLTFCNCEKCNEVKIEIIAETFINE
jgi:hypothetical protein